MHKKFSVFSLIIHCWLISLYDKLKLGYNRALILVIVEYILTALENPT
jgi:hypothetical protein